MVSFTSVEKEKNDVQLSVFNKHVQLLRSNTCVWTVGPTLTPEVQ